MRSLIHRLLLLRAERAAAVSEYAAIFAVLVITVVVCINILGERLRDATVRVDSTLARDSGLTRITHGPHPGDFEYQPPAENGKIGSSDSANKKLATPAEAAGRQAREHSN